MNALNEPRFIFPHLDYPNLPGARCATGIHPDATQIYPDSFYAKDSEKRKKDRTKEFCNPCPVRLQCLQWALQHHEQWGIWGGLDSRQRNKLLKQRRGK